MLAAVSENGLLLRHASDELQNDRAFILAAVRENGYALRSVSATVSNDRAVVLAAVSQNGRALEYASDEFKNDREVVLAAVSQNGWALWHASEALREDINFLLAAVDENRDCIGLIEASLLPPLSQRLSAKRMLTFMPGTHYSEQVGQLLTGLLILSSQSARVEIIREAKRSKDSSLVSPGILFLYQSIKRVLLGSVRSEQSRAKMANLYGTLVSRSHIDYMGLVGDYLTLSDVMNLMQTSANYYIPTAHSFWPSVGSNDSSVDQHITVESLPESYRTFIR